MEPQRISSPPTDDCNSGKGQDFEQEASGSAVNRSVSGREIGPQLALVVEAWPDPPEAVKAGIVALVKAART